MATVEREIVINRLPEQVAAYMDTARSWPEWFAGVQSAEPDAAHPAVGSAVKVAYKSMGTTFNLTMTLDEYQRGRLANYQLAGMITGVNRFTLSPEGDGTRVHAFFDYDVPGGGLGKIFDKLVLERANAENLEKSLITLKARLEG